MILNESLTSILHAHDLHHAPQWLIDEQILLFGKMIKWE